MRRTGRDAGIINRLVAVIIDFLEFGCQFPEQILLLVLLIRSDLGPLEFDEPGLLKDDLVLEF
jgi:hypothetical protein